VVAPGWSREAAIGFCGKIPARGDFVGAGLPRAFTEPWGRWIEQMIAASRAALGEAWLPAWLEAPVWRFALSPGICGPHALVGLWMPSVDSIGRHYPLTVAAVTSHTDHRALIRKAGGFLAAAERAGRDALKNWLPPDELAARVDAAGIEPSADPDIDRMCSPPGSGVWWTQGGPRVSATTLASPALPDENTFFAMVGSCKSIPAAPCPPSA
jgi:type VI secretion system protein ImpM